MALSKIINLHAVWCGPCKQFESVFKNVSNDEKYKDIIFQRFDIEEDEGSLLVEKYTIKSVPTTLLLDENDEVIMKVSGSIPETDFKNLIDSKIS